MILHLFVVVLTLRSITPSVIGRLPLTHRTINHELGTEQMNLKEE